MNSVLVVLSSLNDWNPYYKTESAISVAEYLEHKYEDDPSFVINLSNSYTYNSDGYYCSLLALARGQKIIPSVETLNRLESGAGIRLTANLQKACYQYIKKNNITDKRWYLNIYFGRCKEPELAKIARYIFEFYRCPILQVEFNIHERNQIENIRYLPLNDLSNEEQDYFANGLDSFNPKIWQRPHKSKQARYSIGILYDPNEEFPPSDKQAMRKFLDVAKRMNLHAELITEEDYNRILEFDALFIRTTTALNHYTFRFAETAMLNDMVVIDDPASIIRCTNKVYLKELFEKNNIPAPQSTLLFKTNENHFDDISSQIGSPFILKIPDGSFSVGMHKIENEMELKSALETMFKESSIILAQEFTPTEFDWRIGILDGEPLFACQYFMAKGHWQIYNHDVKGKNLCGPWKTIPMYNVPNNVKETALKAASLIGKGLYGVDLKVINGKAIVIEINDNPSIDHEVEDAVLGDEVYYRVLSYFVHKLDQMHAR